MVKGYGSGVVDLSLLIIGTNKNNCFIGSLSNDSDVDYLKIDAGSLTSSRVGIRIHLFRA